MTEKEQMLTTILNCRRIDLYTEELSLTKEQKNQLVEMEQRRKNGEPLQYILGSCEFVGLPLKVDQRVLVPRPETEIMVEYILSAAERFNRGLNILDLGVGSGNISVALAKFIDDCTITAIDVSAEALELAKENAELNGVDDKIDFVCQDMVAYLMEQIENGRNFDIIVSNPPYISTADMKKLPQDVRHEPRIALEAGEDGLLFYKPIIEAATVILPYDGMLAMEIGDGQDKALKEFSSRYNDIKCVQFVEDYVGTNRVIVVELSNQKPVNRCFQSAAQYG